MAYGIIIRDASGNIVLDNNERIARMLDNFSTSTATGSRTYDPGGGQISFTVVSGDYGTFYSGPQISLSGNTISWSFAGLVSPVNILVWAF